MTLDENEKWEKVRSIIELNNLDISCCSDDFYIIGGWDDLERLVQYYNGFAVRKKYGDIRVSSEGICLGDTDIHESGNSFSNAISSPFVKPDDQYNIDDILGDWGFSDEYSCCGHCGNSIRTSPDSYSWTPDFWINNGEIICGSCIREDEELIELYIEYLTNNPEDANAILKESTLENLGFKKCNCGEEECHFEAGWYEGQNDDPKRILRKAINKNPDKEYIFDIISEGQFDTHFTLWSRAIYGEVEDISIDETT